MQFFVVLLVLLVAGGALADSAGQAAFRSGVEASRAGEYATALARFEAARAAGLDTPALDFNFGVVLYRLDRPDEAARAFRRAYRSPAMAGPAAYNLGRIARERGDTAEAARWFRRSAEAARTEALRQHAWTALAELGESPPRWYALIALGGGYDSNVALTPDDVAGASRESDAFLSGEIFARYRLHGGFYLFGSAYTENWFEEDDHDQMVLAGGLGWRAAPGGWRPDGRAVLRQRYLAGDIYETAFLTDAGVSRPVGRAEIRMGVGADHLEGGSGFAFLDGYRIRGGLRWRRPGTGGRWTLYALAEQVDREDAEGADSFHSLSYDAGLVRIRHRRGLASGRVLRIDAGWTGFRFADPEVRAGETIGTRRETLLSAGAEIEWPLITPWRLITRLEGESRSSSIDDFEYDRVRVHLTVQREF